jgi:hypothetical protein
MQSLDSCHAAPAVHPHTFGPCSANHLPVCAAVHVLLCMCCCAGASCCFTRPSQLCQCAAHVNTPHLAAWLLGCAAVAAGASCCSTRPSSPSYDMWHSFHTAYLAAQLTAWPSSFPCRSQLLFYTSIFTDREVPAGEELTYDYGEQYHTTVRGWGRNEVSYKVQARSAMLHSGYVSHTTMESSTTPR